MRVIASRISLCSVLLSACGISAVPDDAPMKLSFEDLPQDYYIHGSSEIATRVQQLSGKRVEMAGFLSAWGSEGHLYSYYHRHGCTVSLPGVEGVVRLVFPPDSNCRAYGEQARLTGVFSVSPTLQDGYCLDIYQMQVEHVERLE